MFRKQKSKLMRLLRTCLLVSGMLCLSGCLQTVAVIGTGVSAVAEVATAYIQYHKPPVIVKTAECGNIEPIAPDKDWQTRLTEDEKNQIAEQAIRLDKLCPDLEKEK